MTPDAFAGLSSLLTDEDLHLFNEGRHFRLYDKLGAQALKAGGVHFAVWAPNAGEVSVFGSFNGWDKDRNPLRPLGSSGIWAGTVRSAQADDLYKYHIRSRHGVGDKADPLAFCGEAPPRTASVVKHLSYAWGDADWMRRRQDIQSLDRPMSIYEVHAGSWRRKVEEHNRPLGYAELAEELVPYVKQMGFTHIELMPVMEHPFGGSWGYQTTGYFAPSRRYGTPEELMMLIDRCHQAGIGVILDWAPSHFPDDPHGLSHFDGTHLYEHADPRQGKHPDWDSCIFNYGRNEVRSFLISSALFWLDKYHADGLRVDAVASMIYLDYSRRAGEWIPNIHGGRENLEALHFLRDLNSAAYQSFPGIHMIAEESTAFPGVTRPVSSGGLGFGMKWDMGWMNDTLRYFRRDPVHRAWHHNELTFRPMYAAHENFLLPLSHDEVVHGKGSLIGKAGSGEGGNFADLRCLYAYMFATPGKKLLFMGGEFAQGAEWNHDRSLDWHLAAHQPHRGIQALVADLNRLYRDEEALQQDFGAAGLEWIEPDDSGNSVLSFLRVATSGRSMILCVFNFSGAAQMDYALGVPKGGEWTEILNTDAPAYGGSGTCMSGTAAARDTPRHHRPFSLRLALPPLTGVWLKWKI